MIKFSVGDKVQCPKNGAGTVLEVQANGLLTIDFRGKTSYYNLPEKLTKVEDSSMIYSALAADLIGPEEKEEVSSATTEESSLRLNSGKPKCDEINPAFILGMASVITKSRDKYPRANWTKPTKFSTPYDSAMRHILAFQSGEDTDPETGESHLCQAAVNLMFLHYYWQNQPENDDRIFKKEKK